ncbi:MAG: helix-turn-helix domain-containing protein [Halanaeroarchaeum sp.]
MSQSCPPPEHVADAPSLGNHPRLWVELDVEVPPTRDCPLASRPETDARGTVQLAGDTCHLTLEPHGSGGPEVTTVASDVDETCVCTAICAPGFAPVEMTVEGGRIAIGAYARDRDALSAATDRLEDVAEQWRLRRLSAPDAEGFDGSLSRSSRIDELNVTEKQREAVLTAVDRGYYRTPRESSLGDIAAELNITRSALSQRLNAVESKLITSLTDDLASFSR